MNILEMVFIALVVVLVMLVWFFINRASVRANEQIKLLHEIVEQQRQQLALLNMLVPQEVREEKAEDADALQIQERDDVLAFKNVIPER
ncbi:YebO family protein [Brenneria roseae]|uniref:YebO family protein n=1 Tax=Brenneria roseae TaxID=1509241 RepID=UPI003CD0C6F0